MKLKKLVAFGLAATLTVAPVAVFADDATAPVTGEEATVPGGVNYIDTTVYKVTLPTTTGLDFVLDPQGLSALDASTPAQPAVADKGKIVGGVGTTCMNKSSVPIKLTASFYVTDAAGKASASATLVDEASKVTADGNEVLLQIVPNGATAPTATEAGDLKTYTGWSSTDGDITAVTATAASGASKVVFALAPADYEFTGDKDAGYEYTPKAAGTGVTTETIAAFKIAGQVSKGGDWSKFTGDNKESLVLHCVFAFEGLKEIGTDACSTTAAGLVADESKLTALTSDLTATMAKGATANLVFNARATVTKAVMTKYGDKTMTTAIDSAKGTISGSTFTLLGSYASKLVSDTEITLTLSDGTTQKVLITITE